MCFEEKRTTMRNVVFSLDFFSFTAWIFYGLAMLSLLVMRKTRAKEPRPFKAGSRP
jgi:hypothetical protein